VGVRGCLHLPGTTPDAFPDEDTMLPAARTRSRVVAAVLCLSLVPLAAVSAVSAAGSAGVRATSATQLRHGNHCHRNAIDVPSCGVLWGVFKPRVAVPGQSDWSAHYPALERAIGRRLDLVKNYVGWAPGATFPSRPDRRLLHHHRTLYFSWNPVNFATDKIVSYASIASGAWDQAVIRPEARHLEHFAKRHHRRIFLDFGHEFDADSHANLGTATQFAAAYRHIEDVMRRVGVHNVIWSWVSTGYLGNAKAIRAGFPGSRYVDWIGYDPYNFAYCTGHDWHSTYSTFHPFYRWTSHQRGMRHKPLLASEYGTAPGPRARNWYAAIPNTLQRLPRLRALIQFSGPTITPCAVQLRSSHAALSGFIHAARAPHVIGR
jgi:hypothetical protein